MTQDLGHTDTPLLPGSKYRVHDGTRPHPKVVYPGRPCMFSGGEILPAVPPDDAVILFDGKDLSGWISPKDGSPAAWKVENGYMEVVPKTGYISTREEFGDCQLHVEWATPAVPSGNSQGRSNSGIFMMGKYEIQVLDCYDNPTYADGVTGGIYGQFPPLVNACRRPGEWQIYDIIWEAPRFESDKLISPAYITVLFNGVVVQNHTELIGPTLYKKTEPYSPHPPVGPLMLQDHNNPIRFRNIWYRPLKKIDF
ncbi:MAG: DUF1080 domain-containing protein [Eubacteriales bacterium]|nr:DUF1080 domain-containing protein [Eubacteriales bacterium]